MDNKGMEIAINQLVTIILGIIVLGGGILIFYNIINHVNDNKENLEREIERKIMEQLQSGSQVFIYPDNQKVEKGGTITVGVGVNNILDTEKTFYIKVNSVDPTITGITNPSDGEISVLAQGKKVQLILISFPKNAERKEYAFPVRVYTTQTPTDETQYGDARVIKITIN